CLAVPDKRFTFDHGREPTLLRELIGAYLARPSEPTPAQVFDAVAKAVVVDVGAIWVGAPAVADPMPEHGPHAALGLARGLVAHGGYHDVHCTVWTPASFAEVMGEAIRLDLLPFGFASVDPTRPGEAEFMATLVKRSAASPEERARSVPSLDRERHHDFPKPGRRSGLARLKQAFTPR
ncbi:MAG: methyltransferase type 12, partial [Methylobacteriaceae bacterium]|nr:methyltransferase type 12 [Methylobacteriaceae bacterium]